MPRRTYWIPKRQRAEGDELDEELALCLEQWEGCLGLEPSLRTRADWTAAWSRWGDVILPEFVELRPGCRPAAMYAAGILPPVPLDEPLPPGHRFKSYFVADGGGGVCHWQARPPYQRCEGAWLFELGVIDRAEYRRHLGTWLGHGLRCGQGDAAWRRA